MSFRVLVKNSVPASASPYRLLDNRDCEVSWANKFLDAQRLRHIRATMATSRKERKPFQKRATCSAERGTITRRGSRRRRAVVIFRRGRPPPKGKYVVYVCRKDAFPGISFP